MPSRVGEPSVIEAERVGFERSSLLMEYLSRISGEPIICYINLSSYACMASSRDSESPSEPDFVGEVMPAELGLVRRINGDTGR